MSRTRKQPYTGSKGITRSCRNHGSCRYCLSNRLYQYRKEEERAKSSLNDNPTEEENRYYDNSEDVFLLLQGLQEDFEEEGKEFEDGYDKWINTWYREY